jgi:hypothetical protein
MSVITRTIEAAGGAYAPGHLGELTQTVDFALMDSALKETGTRERRLRLGCRTAAVSGIAPGSWQVAVRQVRGGRS